MDTISTPATVAIILFRLVFAAVAGAAVGVNRELRQKPAGLRTHALVAIGAALLTLIGLEMSAQPGPTELNALSRVVQGIVAGVGFIGGGVILHRDDSQGVHGLSTAASIWVVAAAGIASGAGMWRSALIAVALALLVLVGGTPIDRALRSRRAGDDSRV